MAMHRSVAASTQCLADVGINISAIFEQSKHIDDRQLQLETGSNTTLEHEAERFELWAVNLGLYHYGHSSLDYRLRDVEFLQEVFNSLLGDLQTSLRQISHKDTFGNYITATVTREAAGSVLTRSEQQELTDDYGSDSDQDQEDNNALLLRDISDIIDRLYKISTKIRTSSSRLRSSKALQHREVDEDTKVDLFEEFQKVDAHHLRELFRCYQRSLTVEAESFLQARLSVANTRRRQQFGYWRQHHQKMTHVSTRERQDNGPTRVSTTPSQTQPRNTLEQIDPTNVAPAVAVPSATTATHLTATRIRLDDQDSVISISTYAGSEQGTDEAQDFPEPPKSFHGLKYFQCPYCYTLCSGSHLEKKAWRSHLIHDLRPYICTYERCELAQVMYDRRQDWVEHESSMHRKSWRCGEHPDQTFANISAYEHHLCEYHLDKAKEGLEELLKAGETIAPCPERPCPFCFATFESNETMERHVAKHLERVARFALPRSTGLEEERDDISNTDNQVEGTRVSYSSLSALSEESNTEVETESSYLSTRAQPVSSEALEHYQEAGELRSTSRVHEFVTNLQKFSTHGQQGESVTATYLSGLENIPFLHGLDLSLAPSSAQEALIGRDHLLEALSRLVLDPGITKSRIVAILGKGGTWKSRLVHTFAQQKHESYSSIIWLNASSERILRRDMLKMVRSIAQKDSHTTFDMSGQEEEEDFAVQELRKWLSIPGNDNWLLIFDAYDSGQEGPNGFDIQRYFPEENHGTILITSRLASGFEFAENMRLEAFTEYKSSERRVSLYPEESDDAELNIGRHDEVADKAEHNRTISFPDITTSGVEAEITTPYTKITTSYPKVWQRPEIQFSAASNSEPNTRVKNTSKESNSQMLQHYLEQPSHSEQFVAGQHQERDRNQQLEQRLNKALDTIAENPLAPVNFAMMTRDEEVEQKQNAARNKSQYPGGDGAHEYPRK